MDAGFSRHLTKPVDWQELKTAIQKITSEQASRSLRPGATAPRLRYRRFAPIRWALARIPIIAQARSRRNKRKGG